MIPPVYQRVCELYEGVERSFEAVIILVLSGVSRVVEESLRELEETWKVTSLSWAIAQIRLAAATTFSARAAKDRSLTFGVQ